MAGKNPAISFMESLTARTEFASALNQICAERGIQPEVVLESIKAAILAAYRKDAILKSEELEEETKYEVEIDSQTGSAKLFYLPKGKKGKKKDITPPGFGRIAAQTAKQVILQKIREAEKAAVLEEYAKRVDALVNGMVLRFDGRNVIVDVGKTEGIMPPSEQVKTEQYKLNQRLTFYIVAIRESPRGQEIIVSRGHPGLIKGLFKREVPEVNSGAVKIVDIAREAGNRSKVAVSSTQPGVDPVGSCVGQKGVRVQTVIHELNNEKIDIIQYSEDPEKFIASALSPAEKVKATLNKKAKTAVVTVPEDQISLAIGKEGQNVRLAAKLTGFKIDIKSEEEKSKKKKTERKEKTTKKEKKIKKTKTTPAKTTKKISKKSTQEPEEKKEESSTKGKNL